MRSYTPDLRTLRQDLHHWTFFMLDPDDSMWMESGVAYRRNGSEWLTYTSNTLSAEGYSWLINNIGHQHDSYWDIDRFHYCSADELPDIRADWRATATLIDDDRRNWYFDISGLIGFKDPSHAMMFKLAWS